MGSNGIWIEQGQESRYCVFECRGEAFAFPALAVRNVTPACELSPLPLSHSSLAGLAYVHKQFVPVFDLRNWISPGKTFRKTGQQTLFLNSDCGPWGLLIDQVLGLVSIEVSFGGDRSQASGWSSVNIGSATFQERFVSIVEADLLFELLNFHLREQWKNLDEKQSKHETDLEPVTLT